MLNKIIVNLQNKLINNFVQIRNFALNDMIGQQKRSHDIKQPTKVKLTISV